MLLCKAGGIRLISAEHAPQCGAINFTDGWRQCITTDAACSNLFRVSTWSTPKCKTSILPSRNPFTIRLEQAAGHHCPHDSRVTGFQIGAKLCSIAVDQSVVYAGRKALSLNA